MSHILTVDDWLEDPYDLRGQACALPFYDIKLNGETFHKIHPRSTDENKALLERTLRREIEQTYTFFRVNYDGDYPRDVVHHDSELGGYVGLVYLTNPTNCRGGTRLWRHRPTGRVTYPNQRFLKRIGKSPAREYAKFNDSWRDLSHWEEAETAEMKFNRLVVFPAECFHSRWPHNAFGSTPSDGRLIWITFFHLKGNECPK